MEIEVKLSTFSFCLTDKKVNMTHQKGNPQLTTNTSLGPFIRESYLRSVPTDQPHVLFLVTLSPVTSPITRLYLFDDPSGVIQGVQENNKVCTYIPDAMQFPCYVATKMVTLVIY